MGADLVADFIRRETQRLTDLWESAVRRELPEIRGMTRTALLDHMPEFLDGLAAWIDGETERAAEGFEKLVQGHALQRLGHGVDVETLTREYSTLRRVLLTELLVVPSIDNVRPGLVRLNEGMDHAIGEALRRYAASRDEIRERFIGILGHDLRDPLATIMLSANRLRDSSFQSLGARIERACDRMQRMIGDVLDFARGHLGQGIPANPSLNDLGEICRAAIDEVGAAHPGRPITLEASGDLRGAFDRDRVMQAITNLLSNAVEHGLGDIGLKACETPDRHALVTQVTSHGPAIPKDNLDKIFDPFARGEQLASRGLGLGLFIVQQIALAHGGSVEVASADEATTFTIQWPRVPGDGRRASATC